MFCFAGAIRNGMRAFSWTRSWYGCARSMRRIQQRKRRACETSSSRIGSRKFRCARVAAAVAGRPHTCNHAAAAAQKICGGPSREAPAGAGEGNVGTPGAAVTAPRSVQAAAELDCHLRQRHGRGARVAAGKHRRGIYQRQAAISSLCVIVGVVARSVELGPDSVYENGTLCRWRVHMCTCVTSCVCVCALEECMFISSIVCSQNRQPDRQPPKQLTMTPLRAASR